MSLKRRQALALGEDQEIEFRDLCRQGLSFVEEKGENRLLSAAITMEYRVSIYFAGI